MSSQLHVSQGNCRLSHFRACIRLRDGVATINTQLGASHVARGIGQEEGNGAHKVLRLAHFALRDEGNPLLGELGVVVKDLLGAFGGNMLAGFDQEAIRLTVLTVQ